MACKGGRLSQEAPAVRFLPVMGISRIGEPYGRYPPPIARDGRGLTSKKTGFTKPLLSLTILNFLERQTLSPFCARRPPCEFADRNEAVHPCQAFKKNHQWVAADRVTGPDL